jgi:hypothetical protein
MPGTLDDLSFTVWPPAIDISTPANQQVFSPQFGVTNTSASETISLTHALLLVPVTTTGTNLAQNTAMTPNAITSGWQFSRAAAPPNDPGYAAFALLPVDGIGAIAPGGSVAFVLTGVAVDTIAGTAVLRLQAKTSAGVWAPTSSIQLTTPSTTPTITRYSITPADPQTLTTLQGQTAVLSWTTSGTAYCVIEDDQGNKWPNLPTSGTLSDTPAQGNAPIQSTPKLGLYYNRTYKLYAFAGGGAESDEGSNFVSVQLPTIFSFSVTPASLPTGQQSTVTWSVANIDPSAGTITLSLTPADGTGTFTIAIPPNQPSGSSVVTPTPQTSTTYTLTVESGYGVSAPAFPPQQVTCPLPAGWQEINSLETLPINSGLAGPGPMGVVAFANALWCWTSSPSPAALYRTSDGVSWTAQTPKPALPPLDGMIVADLGDGEKLWAFGGNPPFLASSSDGINWVILPAPPYAARYLANYLVDDGVIRVLGGQVPSNQANLGDVWSTSDGRSWTPIGDGFPGFALEPSGYGVARLAGNLQTVGLGNDGNLWSFCSSDGGKTWSQATTAIPQSSSDWLASLLPVGGALLLLGVVDSGNPIPNTNQLALVMDSAGAWSVSANLSPPIWGAGVWSAAVYQGCLWLAAGMVTSGTLRVFRLNQVLPGTAFTLTPPNSALE